jgi:hypothetical protein
MQSVRDGTGKRPLRKKKVTPGDLTEKKYIFSGARAKKIRQPGNHFKMDFHFRPRPGGGGRARHRREP